MELLHCEKLKKQQMELEKAKMDLVRHPNVERKLEQQELIYWHKCLLLISPTINTCFCHFLG